MITNKLSVLMAERKLKATHISSDTGIARSTLSGLINESSKMIQFETINTLCNYLHVTPQDFFVYSPFDVYFDTQPTSVSTYYDPSRTLENDLDPLGITSFKADIFVKVSKNGKPYSTFELTASLAQEYTIPREYFPISTDLGIPTIEIVLLSPDGKFPEFWNNKSLSYFYSLVSRNLYANFSSTAILYLNKNANTKIFDYSDFSISLPVDKF